jgi:hypothetical protein
VKGSSHGVVEVLCRYIHGWIQENHEEVQSHLPVSRPRFEPRIFRIHVESVATRPVCSVKNIY